jgi:uncharacterized protein
MKILITGATGLLGSKLVPKLIEAGHELVIISRVSQKSYLGVEQVFSWNQLNSFPDEILKDVEIIIHLAGASLAQGRWTAARKKKIINSRVQTAQMLFDATANANIDLKLYVSASAVGFYPYSETMLFAENDNMGTGFLSNVCNMWELSATNFKNKGTRTVIMRLGSILAHDGGVLKPMLKAVKLGMGAKMGRGNQYLPWISIDDAVGFILYAISNKTVEGTYNIVAPEIVDNKTFTSSLKRVMNKRSIVPYIPIFLIRILFGNKSELLLKGHKISSQKLISTGYKFIHPELSKALKSLLL